MTLVFLGLAGGHRPGRLTVAALPVLGLLALPGPAAMFLWQRAPGPRLAGGARLVWATPHFGPGDVATYNDRGPVTLVGVVDYEPDVRDTYQNLRLRAESLALEGSPLVSATGLALVRVPRYPVRAYGDRLAVTGELQTPPILENFSYKDRLSAQIS